MEVSAKGRVEPFERERSLYRRLWSIMRCLGLAAISWAERNLDTCVVGSLRGLVEAVCIIRRGWEATRTGLDVLSVWVRNRVLGLLTLVA